MNQDDQVQIWIDELAQEVTNTIQTIRELASTGAPDPLADSITLARAVHASVLD